LIYAIRQANPQQDSPTPRKKPPVNGGRRPHPCPIGHDQNQKRPGALVVISKTTEYALRAAVFLCDKAHQTATSQQIADATQVPDRYISKVLQQLVQAGVLTSRRGPSGGFTLARSAGQINMLQIVEAVEPVQRITCCPLGLSEHQQTLCPLHKRLDEIAAASQESLAETTLADLVSRPGIAPLGIHPSPLCTACPKTKPKRAAAPPNKHNSPT